MNYSELSQRRQRVMGPAYRLFYEQPLHLVRGEGVWLYGDDGNKYLDCYNNVASVGHCHPRVVEAISKQAAQLNTHTRYLHENVVRYAERLAATLPEKLSVCMFTCTGTEANDLALRMARAVTGNSGVIVLEDAYHGNSNSVFDLSTEDYPAAEKPAHIATVEAPDGFRGRYRGDSPDTGIAYGAMIGAAAERLAGCGHPPAMFIADNIFSSSGVLTPPPEYLREAYRQVRAAGGLAVADEVQSGLWRLGDSAWAFESAGVVPDIVTMGKPLGAGHPVAAVVTTQEIAGKFADKYHYFNTFGGNPVSAAAGMAVLDVIRERDIPGNVRSTGEYLEQGLQSLQSRFAQVADIRGRGLFYGIELVKDGKELAPAGADAQRLREHLRDNGVLLGTTGPHGNVVKIRPPMVFNRRHADILLDKLERGLQWLY